MERKVGLIPKVMMSGPLGVKEYGVLVTDRRTIFVLEKKSSAAIGGAIGGAIGAIIADAMTSSERSFDHENENPDRLASDERNVVVPHDQVSRIRLKKGLSGCSLLMEYGDSSGKAQKVKAILMPPPELIQRRKREGVKGKAVVADYARSAQRVFELALPVSVAQSGEWMM